MKERRWSYTHHKLSGPADFWLSSGYEPRNGRFWLLLSFRRHRVIIDRLPQGAL